LTSNSTSAATLYDEIAQQYIDLLKNETFKLEFVTDKPGAAIIGTRAIVFG